RTGRGDVARQVLDRGLADGVLDEAGQDDVGGEPGHAGVLDVHQGGQGALGQVELEVDDLPVDVDQRPRLAAVDGVDPVDVQLEGGGVEDGDPLEAVREGEPRPGVPVAVGDQVRDGVAPLEERLAGRLGVVDVVDVDRASGDPVALVLHVP